MLKPRTLISILIVSGLFVLNDLRREAVCRFCVKWKFFVVVFNDLRREAVCRFCIKWKFFVFVFNYLRPEVDCRFVDIYGIVAHSFLLKTFKDWSQFLFGSWRNNLNQVCTQRVTQWCVQPDWGYFEWTEQIISINPYKLIQTFFAMIL